MSINSGDNLDLRRQIGSTKLLQEDFTFVDPTVGAHTHPESDITNLVSDLAGKAALSHTHVKADVTDFAHTHAQADITSLVSDLAAKSAIGHTHPKTEISDTGTWETSEIPDLAASKITSGQFVMARLASGTPDGTKFIRDDGTLQTPPGGGSVNIKETEIDFGSSGVRSKSFSITDADVSATSQIIPLLSFKAVSGQQADEAEMEAENLHFTAQAGTGSFTLYGAARGGTVMKKYLVNYLVG